MSRHIGSDFDRFLEEENLRDPTEAVAARRVLAFRLRQIMRDQGLDAVQLAARLDLDADHLHQLLGPAAEQVDLLFLARVAERLSGLQEGAGKADLKALSDRLKEIYLRT